MAERFQLDVVDAKLKQMRQMHDDLSLIIASVLTSGALQRGSGRATPRGRKEPHERLAAAQSPKRSSQLPA